MKSNFTILLLTAFIFCLLACTKETLPPEEEITEPSVEVALEGLWMGTYLAQNHPEQPPYIYSFTIQEDSTLLVESEFNLKLYPASGKWNLVDSIFTGSYQYPKDPYGNAITQNATAVFDNIKGEMTGTWKDIYGSGTFFLKKVK